LFETYAGLGKIGLNISDVKFEDDLSFKIKGYGKYPEIEFTQEWSGLHYFVADVPDDNIQSTAEQFIRDMQLLLLNEIFKTCHTITFKQIASDIIPLDFHVVVLSKNKVQVPSNFIEKKIGNVSVAFDPKEIYSPGTMSYVFGSEDLEGKSILLYHAYVEVAADFMMNMMRRMIRLYHEADNAVNSVESSKDLDSIRKTMDVIDGITKECSESFGKLIQARNNFRHKLEEFHRAKLGKIEKDLASALEVEKSLVKINLDAEYMHVQWQDVLIEFLKNLDSTLDARVMLYGAQRKRGFFG
jgi:hypothetical protein